MADVRLIDANEVMQRNEEAFRKAQANPAENLVSVIQYHTVKEMVSSSPTVDAAPVVHGRWIEDDETARRYCSRCGFSIRDDASYELYGDYQVKPKHCPECGAKMDLEVSDGAT